MSVNAICFHPNGQWLLSGSKDAHLKIWDITDDFALHLSIPAHNYAIYSIVFHPEGHLFATGSRDKTIKIWDSENLDFLLRIDAANHLGHVNSVNDLKWTSHKGYLISGSDDRSLIVWEISSEESL
jgi:WD40 repeat protein